MNRIGLPITLITLALFAAAPAFAKPPKETVTAQGSQITLNLKDADIRQVARLVSSITGKNFIVDPRANGHVTVISAKPISADALFSVFLSVLEVHGLTAQPSGHNTWKIVPAVEGRQMPGYESSDLGKAPGAAMITEVVQLQNVQVAQLVAALRPLMSSTAQLAAYAAANMLIISGRAGNVRRIISLVHHLDKPLSSQFELIKLQYASASDISQVLSSMLQASSSQGQIPLKIAADPRSNSILVTGSPSERLQVRALIERLDQPGQRTGNTQVIYLHYAQAEDLAKILQGYVKSKQQANSGTKSGSKPVINIVADKNINAIIATAPPKTMSEINQIVKDLDVRRAQVLVQGIIAELSNTESAQLGISWAALSSSAAALTNWPNGVVNLAQQAEGLGSSTDLTGVGGVGTGTGLSLPQGLLFGVGRIVKDGTSFVALLNALSGNSSTNILSTPSLVALDNEKSSLVSGQNVGLVNGQYTNTTGVNATGSSYINPFQTVNRQQLGITLDITPQINYAGDTVTLKIDVKDSSLGTVQAGTSGASTNNREIKTTIIAKNKQILVLGGLIDTQLQQSQSKVPVLGDIPLLGDLFKYRSSKKVRQNLMIFLRPVIIRNASNANEVTRPRYNQIRQLELGRGTKVPLLPGVKPPVLPVLAPFTGSGSGATETEQGTLIQPAPIRATVPTPASSGGPAHGNNG